MSDDKFTQGEWVFSPAKSIYRAKISVNGNIIAVFADPPTNSNARLIAAAPEMYEMLESIFNIEHESGGSLGVDGSFHYKVSEDIFKKVGLLLAKARGE